MNEHAPEIVTLLAWAIIGGGGLFLAMFRWVVGRIEKKLESIEQAIDRTNTTLGAIEKDMRKDLAGLDRRVTRIESVCVTRHSHDKD